MQQFFDHFAIANKTLQERLGAAPNALNKLSALYGMQARAFVQMLSYGLDAVTARAAVHLLNMDIFHAADSYLLKLGEGLLLNSIKSITPPLITKTNPLKFASIRTYSRYSSVGTVTLRDGTTANLIIYDVVKDGENAAGEISYTTLYCAGQYAAQTISSENIDLTPGTFQSIYVAETYKSIWSESIHIHIEGIGEEGLDVRCAWSISELLAYSDTSDVVLCQHTSKGMTITLGDGEVYGSAYNTAALYGQITGVTISYIKTDSTADPDNSTLNLNSDIVIISKAPPVLTRPFKGDTPDTFRSRVISEVFASGKITDEKDLVTEISKIPIIKSCSAEREYNKHFPVATWRNGITYPYGSMVLWSGALYVAMPSDKGVESLPPGDANSSWQVIVAADTYQNLEAMGFFAESAFRYDNATIMLSGLMVADRQYWVETNTYKEYDVVYHAETDALYVCKKAVSGIAPGSDEAEEYWISQLDLENLDDGAPYSVYKIKDYVPITQASYELELKGYFGIAEKLGFTSVVVVPCLDVPVAVNVSYKVPYSVKESATRIITEYVCYNVGATLKASELHSLLTAKLGLSAVYVTFNGGKDFPLIAAPDETGVKKPRYVSTANLDLTITEELK